MEITELQSTPSVIAAMRSGEVDVGNINSEDAVRLTASGDLGLRTTSSSSGRNFFMIVGKNSIASVSDLTGKSFAVARVGSQDQASQPES